jgi:hypothetical protein
MQVAACLPLGLVVSLKQNPDQPEQKLMELEYLDSLAVLQNVMVKAVLLAQVKPEQKDLEGEVSAWRDWMINQTRHQELD